MLHRVWMRPALRTSEAVMLPALQRDVEDERQFSELSPKKASKENSFRPIPEGAMTTALSTYVRPRGSMAGRSVLRAAGRAESPLLGMTRPKYYQKRSARPRRTR